MKKFVRRQSALFFAILLIATSPAGFAQTAAAKKKAPPKPPPTQQELFEYIRSSLILLTPDDGINDNVEVTFNPTTSVLMVAQPSGHCDEFLNALDAKNAVWDQFDPSDSQQTREKLVRLTLVSVAGKPARICYDKSNQVDNSVPQNRIRLLFSFSKAEQWPLFQEKFSKALKQLIALSGAPPVTDIFSDDPKLKDKDKQP
jgi:hypothetical protein